MFLGLMEVEMSICNIFYLNISENFNLTSLICLMGQICKIENVIVTVFQKWYSKWFDRNCQQNFWKLISKHFLAFGNRGNYHTELLLSFSFQKYCWRVCVVLRPELIFCGLRSVNWKVNFQVRKFGKSIQSLN